MPKHRPSIELLVPETYLVEIGRIVTLWAYFEVDFDEALKHFLLRNPEAAKLSKVYPTRFNVRIKLFKDAATLAFKHNKPTLKRFITIADQASKLRDDRDYIAHGRWIAKTKRKGRKFYDTGSFDNLLVKEGNWGNFRKKPLSLKRLKQIAQDISELAAEIQCLLSPLGHWTVEPEITRELQAFRLNSLPRLSIPQTLKPPRQS